MDLNNNLRLIESALRSYIKEIDQKLSNLPDNASDDYFCQLAYEAKDAEELADEIHKQRKL